MGPGYVSGGVQPDGTVTATSRPSPPRSYLPCT